MALRVSDERRPLVLDLYVNEEKSALIIARETGISHVSHLPHAERGGYFSCHFA